MAIEELIKAQWSEFVAEHTAITAPDARSRYDSLKLAESARKAVLLWNRALAERQFSRNVVL